MTIITANAGDNIYAAAKRAISQTHSQFMPYVTLEFNEICIPVSHESCANDVAHIYTLLCRIRQLENK